MNLMVYEITLTFEFAKAIFRRLSKSHMKIWVSRESQNYGPYSLEELILYLDQGYFASEDFACEAKAQAEWRTLGDFVNHRHIASAQSKPKLADPGISKKTVHRKSANSKNTCMELDFRKAIEVPIIGGMWVGLATLIATFLISPVTLYMSLEIGIYLIGFIWLMGNLIIVLLWQSDIKPRKNILEILKLELQKKIGSVDGLIGYLSDFAQNYGEETLEDAIGNFDLLGVAKGFLISKVTESFIDEKSKKERESLASKIILLEKAIEKTGFAYTKSVLITFPALGLIFIGVLELTSP